MRIKFHAHISAQLNRFAWLCFGKWCKTRCLRAATSHLPISIFHLPCIIFLTIVSHYFRLKYHTICQQSRHKSLLCAIASVSKVLNTAVVLVFNRKLLLTLSTLTINCSSLSMNSSCLRNISIKLLFGAAFWFYAPVQNSLFNKCISRRKIQLEFEAFRVKKGTLLINTPANYYNNRSKHFAMITPCLANYDGVAHGCNVSEALKLISFGWQCFWWILLH